jgi:hypothetical protein
MKGEIAYSATIQVRITQKVKPLSTENMELVHGNSHGEVKLGPNYLSQFKLLLHDIANSVIAFLARKMINSSSHRNSSLILFKKKSILEFKGGKLSI